MVSEERRTGILRLGIRFFLAAALSASHIPGGGAPLALGCIAACGSGLGSIAALLGAGMGLALFLDFSEGLAQLGSAILIATAMSALAGLEITRKRWFSALCAGGLYLVVKLVYVLQSADLLGALPPCMMAAALAAFSAWAFQPALSQRETAEPRALWALAAGLLSTLCSVEVEGVSAGRLLLFALVLLTGWQSGSGEGTKAGLAAGLLADWMGGGTGCLFTAAFALGGLLSGSTAGHRRLPAALRGLAGLALPALSAGSLTGQALLAEGALGAMLFLLLPGRLFGGKRLEEPKAAVPAIPLRSRLNRAAAAFHDLYDSLGRTAPADREENPAVIFDRAAEKTCRDCALCGNCWKKEYVGTFNALNDATPRLLERGRALPKDFPSYFADRCIHLQDFLGAVNGELNAYLLRRRYRKELEETRRSARGQYAQIGELLSATAAGLEAAPASGGERWSYRIGAALRPKSGENVCGDSLMSFETERGLLCLLLSDGSGCGEAARKESALTCRLLRQFLEAGIEPEAALKTINAALALRSEETGSFATVDLLTLSLAGGEAAVYKYGAAPTYLKRGGTVRRITGSALPAGLRTVPGAPDVTRFPMEGGSYAILVSDGVADALSDEWLQNYLAGWDGTDPQNLANLILQETARRGTLSDDCGVQVLLTEEPGKHRV